MRTPGVDGYGVVYARERAGAGRVIGYRGYIDLVDSRRLLVRTSTSELLLFRDEVAWLTLDSVTTKSKTRFDAAEWKGITDPRLGRSIRDSVFAATANADAFRGIEGQVLEITPQSLLFATDTNRIVFGRSAIRRVKLDSAARLRDSALHTQLQNWRFTISSWWSPDKPSVVRLAQSITPANGLQFLDVLPREAAIIAAIAALFVLLFGALGAAYDVLVWIRYGRELDHAQKELDIFLKATSTTHEEGTRSEPPVEWPFLTRKSDWRLTVPSRPLTLAAAISAGLTEYVWPGKTGHEYDQDLTRVSQLRSSNHFAYRMEILVAPALECIVFVPTVILTGLFWFATFSIPQSGAPDTTLQFLTALLFSVLLTGVAVHSGRAAWYGGKLRQESAGSWSPEPTQRLVFILDGAKPPRQWRFWSRKNTKQLSIQSYTVQWDGRRGWLTVAVSNTIPDAVPAGAILEIQLRGSAEQISIPAARVASYADALVFEFQRPTAVSSTASAEESPTA
jgi:hypothetical protein